MLIFITSIYLLLDTFDTAANVMGNGGLSLLISKIAEQQLNRNNLKASRRLV